MLMVPAGVGKLERLTMFTLSPATWKGYESAIIHVIYTFLDGLLKICIKHKYTPK